LPIALLPETHPKSWALVSPARAKEAGLDVALEYHVPATGGTMWADAFVIPADAPIKDNAHAFLDFMMRPEVIAAATNDTAYANANIAANPFVAPAVMANPAIYPDDAVKARIWLPEAVSPEYDTARTRAWQRIMTGG
jgi:putrescine transport system substrate-binding protein